MNYQIFKFMTGSEFNVMLFSKEQAFVRKRKFSEQIIAKFGKLGNFSIISETTVRPFKEKCGFLSINRIGAKTKTHAICGQRSQL